MSETYQGQQTDVGIMVGGWVCEACDLFIEEDDQDFDYDGEFDDD